jgi:hypothetical protein
VPHLRFAAVFLVYSIVWTVPCGVHENLPMAMSAKFANQLGIRFQTQKVLPFEPLSCFTQGAIALIHSARFA